MTLTNSQKELLNTILTMPVGTVMRKGTTERILYGVMPPGMIGYKTNRSKTRVTFVNVEIFIKWAEKAEFVN